MEQSGGRRDETAVAGHDRPWRRILRTKTARLRTVTAAITRSRHRALFESHEEDSLPTRTARFLIQDHFPQPAAQYARRASLWGRIFLTARSDV